MKKNLKNKGFTLVELIIVIAVLGVLAAIVVPKFGNVTKQAKKSVDYTNAKIIGDAVTLALENGDITYNNKGNELRNPNYEGKGSSVQIVGTGDHLRDVLVPNYLQKMPEAFDEGANRESKHGYIRFMFEVENHQFKMYFLDTTDTNKKIYVYPKSAEN